jgi:hypothetical protein
MPLSPRSKSHSRDLHRRGLSVGEVKPKPAIQASCFALAVVALLLVSCASTTLRTAWFDSDYTGGAFKRILVVGVTPTMTDRRAFDDLFAQALTAAGVQGVPGYQFVPDAPSASEAAFNEGVAKSGADGLLLVRLLGVDQRTQVTTIMVPAAYGPYASLWGPMWYAVPNVQQYQTANVETTLFEVQTHRPVWSATTETLNPTSVAAETPGFAKLIIGQLSARGLLAAAK